MGLKTQGLSAKRLSTDLLVIAVTKKQLSSRSRTKERGSDGISFRDLDRELKGVLKKQLQEEGFKGAKSESSLLTLPGHPRIKAVLIVGWEEKKSSPFDHTIKYQKLGRQVFAQAKARRYRRVAVSNANLDLHEERNAEAFTEGLELARYNFQKYKTEKKPSPAVARQITLLTRKKLSPSVARRVKALTQGAMTARDLVNSPANDCHPGYLVTKCKQIGRAGKMRVQVYDRARLRRLGAGALISVSEGSTHPPYLIKMVYKPRGKAKKVISLVGKGITFDTGGYSLKSSTGMMEMKGDMGGAAAVIGAMEAIAALKPKVEVRAYIPTAENMVSAKATRPGDIVKSMSGKTIEILNTDAEGRLILADALALAERDKCDLIVDLATLTGASVVALGLDYSALFCDDDDLAEKVIASGEEAGERFWHMPLAPEYEKELKSKIADLKNIGDSRWGGCITAALFLKNFIKKTKWIHLDIAGPALKGISKGNAPGFGVRTIARLVSAI